MIIMDEQRHVTSGFSLVELCITLAILATLLALILPAVQASREAARRLICQSKLRSWALATQAFVAVREFFPPAATMRVGEAPDRRVEPARHSLFAHLLPYCDEVTLAGRIDLTRDWNDSANDTWTHQNLASLFLCPSAPGGRHTKHPSDYTTVVRVDPTTQFGLGELLRAERIRNRSGHNAPNWGNRLAVWDGLLLVDEVDYVRKRSSRRTRRPTDVKDGLSRTVLLIENAGKPVCYRYGRPADCQITRFRWASPTIWMTLNDWCGEDQLLNCHNNSQPYGFHPGGLNCVFADGSTRFLSAGVEADQFVSAITAAASD
ncbi:MAG: DUF1559 domain-containing protein [Planctomycetales bacterium]|nr:DUF1559 domain-containing protein [Planctomycetales bacterium]